jgi:hypothetical protein
MAGQGIVNFRKSSYSATGEQCIAAGSGQGTVAVKDTKDWDGFTLNVSAAAWSKFTSAIK